MSGAGKLDSAAARRRISELETDAETSSTDTEARSATRTLLEVSDVAIDKQVRVVGQIDG